MFAIERGNKDIVQLLLEAGADRSLRNKVRMACYLPGPACLVCVVCLTESCCVAAGQPERCGRGQVARDQGAARDIW